MKNILIIGSFPPPFSGVGRVNEYLAPVLMKNGWKVVFFVPDSVRTSVDTDTGLIVYRRRKSLLGIISDIFILLNGFLTVIARKKINRIMIELKKANFPLKGGFLVIYWTLLALHIVKKEHIQLICGYKFHSGGIYGAFLHEITDIPVVINLFGEIYDSFSYFRHIRNIVAYECDTAAGIISMTQHCARSLQKLNLNSYQVNVLPIGIDVDFFSDALLAGTHLDTIGSSDVIRKIMRTVKKFSTGSIVLLYFARMSNEMGLPIVADAVPSIMKENEVKIIIAGRKEDEGLYKKIVTVQNRYKDRLLVLPDIPYDIVPFIYYYSTIVLIPTRGERACGSLSALEAMAMKKPVIASNIGGIPEFVTHEKTGLLIPPNDVDSLVHSIRYFLKNKELINAYGINGRKKVEKEFNKNSVFLAYERYFSHILNTFS